MKSHDYYVYIVTNPGKTVLYTGVTNDIPRRMEEHFNDSINYKKTFAGKYNCYNLIYYEYYQFITNAISREKYIKGLTRKKKEALINHFNPEWKFINDQKEIEKGNLPFWTTDMEDTRPW